MSAIDAVRLRALVLDPLHASALAGLRERCEVTVSQQPDPPLLTRLLADVEVVVMRSGVRLSGADIRAAPHLRVIARAGVGIDNIDLSAARERGVCVFNVPGVSASSTAEFAIGLLLAAARNIPLADRQMRAGEWRKADLCGMELRGSVLGVIGVGRIGSEVARLAQALGMSVIGCVAEETPARRRRLGEEGVRLCSLQELLGTVDACTVHLPLTPETRGLLAASQLAMLRPSAYLVDVSRGGVVDEDALYHALRSGALAGAAKDVFVSERARTRLMELENVVLSPHIGSMTGAAQERIAIQLLESLDCALEGVEVPNRVC